MISKLYNTANGEELLSLKEYDGCQVPSGFYYESDFQERLIMLKYHLINSVSPLLERLIDIEIPKFFYLKEYTLSTEIFGTNINTTIKTNSISKAFLKIDNEFEYINTDYNLNINLEFQTYNNHKLMQYGCQINICLGDETIQDVETEIDYSAWYLYIGNEKTLIDAKFTNDQENKIIGTFLGWLYKSEEEITDD